VVTHALTGILEKTWIWNYEIGRQHPNIGSEPHGKPMIWSRWSRKLLLMRALALCHHPSTLCRASFTFGAIRRLKALVNVPIRRSREDSSADCDCGSDVAEPSRTWQSRQRELGATAAQVPLPGPNAHGPAHGQGDPTDHKVPNTDPIAMGRELLVIDIAQAGLSRGSYHAYTA